MYVDTNVRIMFVDINVKVMYFDIDVKNIHFDINVKTMYDDITVKLNIVDMNVMECNNINWKWAQNDWFGEVIMQKEIKAHLQLVLKTTIKTSYFKCYLSLG